jgi:RimJ/RimL family protein N-acetyltransferase
MPATIRALIHDFMIPYMNAHVITGSYFQHNAGSRKVFEKNGFVFEGVILDCFELPESKTGVKGKKASVGFMRWTRSP